MKQVLTLIFTALLAVSLHAAKLVVEAGGSGGAYTTIQAAIDVAAPGDQIYVYPGNYTGFSITTGGFSILSAVAGQRYQISTTCQVGSITAPVHISNALFINDITNTNGPASPQSIRITDSKFTSYGGVYLSDYENFFVYCQNDTFLDNSRAYLCHGAVTGCVFLGSASVAVYTAYYSPTISGDTVKIIGNHFHSYSGVNLTSTNELVYIEGNYFEGVPGSYTQFYCNSTYTNAATGNTIINNTITIPASVTYSAIGLYYLPGGINDMSKFNILNNVFITPGAASIQSYTNNNGLPPGSLLDYNIFSQSSSNSLTGGVTATGTNNIFSTTANINTTTGAITSGPGIDAGQPNPAYYDLDKTRNDMGCYGGSYSRANFDQPDNGSRVLMLTAPRVVLSGNTATIKADGLAK